MPNKWNLPASNIFNKNFNAKIPVKNEVIIANKKVKLLNVFAYSISSKPKIHAPKITGIDSKNENLAASFGGIPKYMHIDIVEPDLETPGIIATACAIPIMIDEENEISF